MVPIERVLVLLVIGVVTGLAVWWWRRRDGRVVEASGIFDASDLGLPRRQRASVTIVEFTGEGCAPCVTVKQRLDQLASEIGDISVVAIEAGDRLDLADRYHVRRVPTVFITDEKLRIRWRASGVPSDDDLRSALLGPEWSGRPHPDDAVVDAN